MKIYTRTGDQGETGLFGGPRVSKDAPRIEAYGTVDELNAVLGLVLTAPLPPAIGEILRRVQHELFELGAQLATPDPAKHNLSLIGPDKVAAIEAEIDRYEATLPPLKNFILPGGSPAAAWLHLARTVSRRAERRVVTLARSPGEHVSIDAGIYLNRLSDLLFVLARAVNAQAGVADVPWHRPAAP
ncbi:MAG: cob(I)yrinic acid a,c-diamide adenosyltransferase [Pirellulales bacterium]|nr:cob(I)yrinic acid a,c-diamide adenosyltransferase [Pirellulales bacterium]